MDPIYKPPSSLDVTKLAPRKPYPSGGMDTNVPTTSGNPPCNPQTRKGWLLGFTSILMTFDISDELNFFFFMF